MKKKLQSVVILNDDGFVGTTYWLKSYVSLVLTLASTLSVLNAKDSEEKQTVKDKKQILIPAMNLISLVNNLYMIEVWVNTGETPRVYRYLDGLIINQIISNCIYAYHEENPRPSNGKKIYRRLINLATGVFLFLGEAGYMNAVQAFWLSMVCEGIRLNDIYSLKFKEGDNDKKKELRRLALFDLIANRSTFKLGYLFVDRSASAVNNEPLYTTFNLIDIFNHLVISSIILNRPKIKL